LILKLVANIWNTGARLSVCPSVRPSVRPFLYTDMTFDMSQHTIRDFRFHGEQVSSFGLRYRNTDLQFRRQQRR